MLSSKQQHLTSQELQENMALSGLTPEQICADLAFTDARLRATVSVTEAEDPVDAWLLRDYLELAVLDSGGTPRPFTVLTESSRRKARGWYALRTAPRHAFAL